MKIIRLFENFDKWQKEISKFFNKYVYNGDIDNLKYNNDGTVDIISTDEFTISNLDDVDKMPFYVNYCEVLKLVNLSGMTNFEDFGRKIDTLILKWADNRNDRYLFGFLTFKDFDICNTIECDKRINNINFPNLLSIKMPKNVKYDEHMFNNIRNILDRGYTNIRIARILNLVSTRELYEHLKFIASFQDEVNNVIQYLEICKKFGIHKELEKEFDYILPSEDESELF